MKFQISSAGLVDKLKEVRDIDDFLEANKEQMITDSLTDYLNQQLLQKGLSKADVVRGSELDSAYTYQIFSGEKTPSRDKLIAIAFGMQLTDEETQQMLKISGNKELYVRKKRDALILYAIQRKMPIYEANALLYDRGLAILGELKK